VPGATYSFGSCWRGVQPKPVRTLWEVAPSYLRRRLWLDAAVEAGRRGGKPLALCDIKEVTRALRRFVEITSAEGKFL